MNVRVRTAAVVALGLLVMITMSGCLGMAGPNNVAEVGTSHLAGFWPGLWQGLIIPIAFLVSLFNDGVNIYDVHNNGGWYNFGYVLGIIVGATIFGGGAKVRR